VSRPIGYSTDLPLDMDPSFRTLRTDRLEPDLQSTYNVRTMEILYIILHFEVNLHVPVLMSYSMLQVEF